MRPLVFRLLALGVASSGAHAQPATAPADAGPFPSKGMVFLHYADARFLDGLRRHGLAENYGLRLLNTGLDTRTFGEKWSRSPTLADARSSGRPYYIDRLCGGMPYQSLEGLERLAQTLKHDSNFLGFQVHEWGNTPVRDYQRIQSLVIDEGLPFNRESVSTLEKRITNPLLGGGDYTTYRDLFKPLRTLDDVDRYLTDYFRHYVTMTGGQVLAVNGYVQLYHKALQLGAKNVMAEIGNQVPLTALQIACVRGAARQFGKPFGVYYEPWGGRPFGCPCAVGFSPWFADTDLLKRDGAITGFRVGPKLGSSRLLQRRLLFFAWLSGAAYCAEEWGAENYFENWTDYPLTEYGRVAKAFLEVSTRFCRPQPVVPAAIVMPPGYFGIDVRVVTGRQDRICDIAPADTFHMRLRQFAADILTAGPKYGAHDSYNLTPSPWIGCFDVLSDEAPADLLSRYELVVYLSDNQARRARELPGRAFVYRGTRSDSDSLVGRLKAFLPYQIEGAVGCAHARADGRYLLGLFNNVGVTKTESGEVVAPTAERTVVVHGPCGGMECAFGAEHVAEHTAEFVRLRLPGGSVAVLSFPLTRPRH